MFIYQDRQDAGSELAQLISQKQIHEPVLLALPRGGVPVASVISHELGLPFEVLVTRRVEYPGQGHYEIGAIAEDDKALLMEDINYADPRILEAIREERDELHRRVSLYRQGQNLPDLNGKDVILVDDGLTDEEGEALVAAKFARNHGARRVFLAVPVAPQSVKDTVLSQYVDEVLCPHWEEDIETVGEFFQDFSDVTDRQVLELLGREVSPT